MKIQVDVDSVGNENAIVDIGETLGIELLELLEERGNVENDGGADVVDASRVNQSRGE